MPTPQEAHFGQPIKSDQPGGAHITLQLIPKMGEHLYALSLKGSDDKFFPEQNLNFGEDFEEAVRRIAHDALKASVDRYYLGTVKSRLDTDGHWKLTIVAVAQITEPTAPEDHELEEFTESTPAPGLLHWTKQELQAVLDR